MSLQSRSGWLSNLHLGARDPAGNEFVMLGKTFKGLTDERLEVEMVGIAALNLSASYRFADPTSRPRVLMYG